MSIHIKHVSKNFGDFKALDSINIDIQTGDFPNQHIMFFPDTCG